jgi:hypothetical protein
MCVQLVVAAIVVSFSYVRTALGSRIDHSDVVRVYAYSIQEHTQFSSSEI